MAVSQKVEERGWFYHAPAKRQQIVFDDLPPASQIPGLSDLPEFEPEPLPMKKWIRETDSKYVKMAKKGGRPELIRWRSPKPRSDKPVDYPRPDWFYHDDVTDEEQQLQNKDYHLPDYMVHEEYKPDGNDESVRPKRLPYAYDRLSIYEREPGNRPTDKKVKIPEKQMSGQLRLQKTQPKYKNVVVKKPNALLKMQDNLKSSNPRYQAMPEMYNENKDKPHMGKIMSYNYGSEWHNALNDWQTTQDRHQTKIIVPKPKEKIQSEYQEQCSKLMQTKTKKTIEKKISPRMEKKSEPEKEKPLFKLTRFTKVAARTDSHWIPETQVNQKANIKVHTYNEQLQASNNMVPVSH